MKTILTIIVCSFFFTHAVTAQEVEKNLSNARAAYNSGDLEGARFALQQAMYELDLAVGREILKLLPRSLGNLNSSDTDDVVGSANMGFVGLHLSRNYNNDQDQRAELQIIADSPLLAGINAILAMPVIGRDPNQKRIRVDGYRGLLQRSESSDGNISWDMQIPFGSSLLSVSFKDIAEENTVMDMANAIPIQQIARLLQ
jgi:hypothetical protein